MKSNMWEVDRKLTLHFKGHILSEQERREGDSNPRGPRRPNGFQDRRNRPLCHPSPNSMISPPQPIPLLRALGVGSGPMGPMGPMGAWLSVSDE